MRRKGVRCLRTSAFRRGLRAYLVDAGAHELDVGATAVDVLLVLDAVLQHQVLAIVGEGLGQLRRKTVEAGVLARLFQTQMARTQSQW